MVLCNTPIPEIKDMHISNQSTVHVYTAGTHFSQYVLCRYCGDTITLVHSTLFDIDLVFAETALILSVEVSGLKLVRVGEPLLQLHR